MSQISITDLTFAYDGSFDRVFESVSLVLDTNWRLGLIGRNGKGKTTFLKLLMGKYEYRGNISCDLDFEYFPYDIPDKSQNCIDIANVICEDILQWQLERELNLLELDPEILWRSFETLSFGERTKLLLGILFLKENGFLLIDEPTNHLDSYSRKIVSNYLKTKKGFILASHDRVFLDNCVDHILSINRADIQVMRGNFSTWHENKLLTDSFELSENEKLSKEILRLEKSAKRASKWSERAEKEKIGFDPRKTEKSIGRRSFEGAKSKKLMKSSKSFLNRKNKAIEERSGLLKNIERKDGLKISQLEHHRETLICLNNITIRYGDVTACNDVSFTLNKGDRLSLSGKNGSGKSSVISLICGNKLDYEGRIEIASGLKISFVSQDTSFIKGDLSDLAKQAEIDESLLKAILNKFAFDKDMFDKDISDYSEGQKKKVLIAKSLCEKAHVHIWDEPLNFIDILSRIQIEELILEYRPTMLFVEHDEAFCKKTATKAVQLRDLTKQQFFE